MNTGTDEKSKRGLIAVAAVVVIAALGTLLWLTFFSKGSNDDLLVNDDSSVPPKPFEEQPRHPDPVLEEPGFEIALVTVPAVPVDSEMNRNPQTGSWRQRIEVPEGATLITLNVERTEQAAPDVAVEVYALGKADVLTSRVDDTHALNPADAPGSVTVLGPYSTDGEEAIDLIVTSKPKTDSLFRVREIRIWRSEKSYAELANVPSGKWVNDAAPQIQELGTNLAILYLPSGSCSGFAISKNLLLTNHHCIRDLVRPNVQNFCSGLKIVFRHFKDDSSDPSIPAVCKALVAKSKPLDYALIRFSLQKSTQTVRGLAASPYQKQGSPTSQLFVLQHPWGTPAKVSNCEGPPSNVSLDNPSQSRLDSVRSKDCGTSSSRFALVSKQQTQSVVTHSCYTQPGSSGSPVMQGQNVVALHFAADYRYYQTDGTLSLQQNCLEEHLMLWNWGRDICDVLKDARTAAGPTVVDIPSCSSLPTP